MHRPTALLACLLALFLIGPPRAVAGDPHGLSRLATSDESRGWEGVGRLQLGASGFCTGALISERLVLTAAHCLYDGDTGARIPDGEMEFLAGWRDGRAAAYRRVRRSFAHPGYTHGGEVSFERVAVDLAVLELDRPVRTGRILPFRIADGPARGDAVSVVSYARNRANAPSLEESCHVLRKRAGAVVLSCTADFGTSGAPVFRTGANGPEIVSVVSAKARYGGDDVSLGAAFRLAFDELMEARETAPPPLLNGGGLARAQTMAAEPEGKVGRGAKFVRP